MAITATERSQIVELTVMLFNGAPGAEYLSQIVSAYESTGRSLQTLANILADTPIYQTLYPNTQSAAEFADALLTPLGLKDDAFARDFVISKMNAGVSKGAIVYEGYATLNSVPDSANNQYSAANAILNNKVAVAIYYSVDRAVAATDLASLQGALSGVTADPASVTTAKAAIDATLDFTLMAAAASVDEGSSITVHLTNGAPNTEYVLRVDSAHASDVGSQLTMVTTDASGTAHATIAIAADRMTEGAETLTISVVGQASVSTTVVVNDTSMDNAAPAISASATLAVNEGKSATFDVAVVDAEGDAVTVTAAADNGTLVDNGNGTYTYTPNAGFSGSDTITVTAADALGATSTQAIAVAVDPNDAPIAQAAGDAANEGGAVVAGQLVATDADAGDTLTFNLDASVEGLTLNADGSYTFDPAANTAAAALVYSDAPLAVVANYTVTDALGLSSQNTLTITVTPTPLSFTLTRVGTTVQEGASQDYVITASEAVTSPVDVTFTLLPGDGSAGNTGTGNTNTGDFATGSFNPLVSTIAAGETTATFTVTPVNDATTELPESFSVKAEIAGFDALTLGGTAVDATTAGGVGQTFTLTTSIDTIPGLIGSANSAGTDGNDTIVALIDGANNTLNALDSINGGLGNDTLTLNVVGNLAALPGGVTLASVETANVRSSGNLGTVGVIAGAASAALDVSSITDLTALNVTVASSASFKAAATTDVSVSGVAGGIEVNGGKNVTITDTVADNTIRVGSVVVAGVAAAGTGPAGAISVTDSKQGTGAISVDGGTAVTVSASGVTTGTVSIGQGAAATDLPSGAVTVTSTGAAYSAAADVTLGKISIDGGTTVNVTQSAAASAAAAATDASAQTVTQSEVAIDGGAATTSVSVKQDAAVTAENARAATAGVKQVDTVTFIGLATGESVTVGSLTFTAAKALTAAQVASAFANLAAGATQGSAPAGNGVYSGTFGAYSTGAVTTASGVSTVAATASAAATGNTPIVVADTAATDVTSANTTAGLSAVTAITGVMGVTGGKVTVNGAIAGADVLTTVTLDGYGATSSVASDALTSLNLANSGQGLTVTNTVATSLNLGLNNVASSVADPVLALGGTYTTLNITADGANSDLDITAGGVTALTVAGTKSVDLVGSTLGVLKTVTVTGSAGLAINASGASVTAVNTTGTTGTVTATVDADKATYTGGAGKDNVTLFTTTVDNAVSLGGGDDSLTLAAGTNALVSAVSGGDGTDTLVMASADAEAVSVAALFEAKFDGFEKLSLGQVAAGADTVDLANMDDISYVISAGGVAATSLVLNSMAAGGTLELTGAAILTDVNLTDATGGADAFNVVTKVATDNIDFGTLDVAGIETLNVTATDTSTTAAINTATVALKDAALKTVTVGGNANATLTLDANVTALTLIDGTAMSGVLNAYTNGTVAQTILGGSGNDQLVAVGNADTLNGGAGNDTLRVTGDLATLTGGAGADTFNVADPTTNVNSYATITDLAAGDVIKFSGTADAFAASKVSLAETAVFQDYANAAINATDLGDVAWFQLGGNTYVIEHRSADAATSFVNGTDVIVKVTGTVDLSTASFSSEFDTLLIM